MSTQPTHTVGTEPEPLDWQLLTSILDTYETGRPWTTSELTWRLPDPAAAADGLIRLQQNGLVDKINDYLIPTTCARYCRQLERLTHNPRQLQLPL